MVITPNKWVMRGLLASATTMLIIGLFGFLSLGIRADWIAFYTAGNFLLDGDASQLYQAEMIQTWQAPLIGNFIARFLYAPAYAVMYLPIAILPPSLARLAWLLIGMLAALLAASLSTRWSRLSIPVSILVLLAFPPLAFSLAVGQNSAITLAIFTIVASLEWKRRHDYLPGLIAGLALYKPQLLIPLGIYWLVNKRWKTLLGLIGSGAFVATLSLVISPIATMEYIQLTFQYFEVLEYTTVSGQNISFYAIWPPVGILLSVIVITSIIIFRKRADFRLVMAILWVSPLLITPYIIVYDTLLFFLPITFLIPLLKQSRLLGIGVILVWLAGLLAIPLQTTRPLMWAGLGLFMITAFVATNNDLVVVEESH